VLVFCLRVKWVESADQHTSPSSAEIKIER
jgi:hypothetical protein